jgi:hypothetical protein
MSHISAHISAYKQPFSVSKQYCQLKMKKYTHQYEHLAEKERNLGIIGG